MASSSHTSLDHTEMTDLSSLEDDVGVTEDIFLSHSGEQKVFAEFLCVALSSANQTAFFDRLSLPKAAPFPPRIKRAARGCKLGVFVLSDDFFTSKWPMLELEIMVDRKIPLLPLFYRLSPKDLSCPQKLSDWQCAWEKYVDEDQAKRWAEAVRKLRSCNGEVFQKGGREFDYIEKVVAVICAIVPSHAIFDLSSIQGRERLAKEVERHFGSLVEDARRGKRACMVGLYGVGGLGKTTLCKIMVNFYTSRFLGRSCLIEFPTNGDKRDIVQACKMALKKLVNLPDQVLERKDSFDEVIQLMKDHVTKYDVFLAIDNVWPESVEEAERLLGIGFTANSRILLTSRTVPVLRKVLFDHTENSFIGSLPTLNYEDALTIFQKSLKRGDLTSRVQKQIETFVEDYRFNNIYHPLALKALAGHLWSLLDHEDSEGNNHDLACIFAKIDTTDLQSLNDVIRINYLVLPPIKKKMFFDIALWLPERCMTFHYPRTMENAVQWLRFFSESFCKAQIKQHICELGAAGVLQIEIDEYGKEIIWVHDLYFDLAKKEATSIGFLTLAEKVMEGMTCQRTERLFLEGVTGDQCMKNLQQPNCPRLQLLCVDGIRTWRTIHLPALRALALRYPKRRHSRMSLNLLRSFNKINLKGFIQLTFLLIEDCHFVTSLEGLSALCNLQMLQIATCDRLQNLDGLECLTKLEVLRVYGCIALKELSDLGGVTGLETLMLHRNSSLKKVNGRLSPALKEVGVGLCRRLKKLPDLGGVTGLERLQLYDNNSVEDVNGSLKPTLKEVKIDGRFGALKKPLDLGGVTGLERLVLTGNVSLEEVRGLVSPALKDLIVRRCEALKKLPDLGGLTSLERLELTDNDLLEEVSGRRNPALKEVIVARCVALKKLLDLGSMPGLERWMLYGSNSLEELGTQSFSSAPKKRSVICDCPLLTKSSFLEVSGGGWTGDQWHFSSRLLKFIIHLRMEECSTIDVLDVKRLKNLRCLEVRKCGLLIAITGLDALSKLEEVVMYECGRLEDRDGNVGALRRRSNLKLAIDGCPRLS